MKNIETDFDVIKSILAETNDADEGLECLKNINDEYVRLLAQVEELEKKNDRLIDDLDELTDVQDEFDELSESVAIFRDPSNWNGNRFVPVLRYQQTNEPYNLI